MNSPVTRSAPHIHRPARLLAVAACLGAVLLCAPGHADLSQWSAQVAGGTPASYTATNIFTPSVANIGALSGDITYEFIVNGADRATAGSLLGSLAGGQAQAIRFEQWNNTGSYGVTQYGLSDYVFNIPTTYDQNVQLAFVVHAADNTTSLFVNGLDVGAVVPVALSLQGNVAFGGTLMPDGSFLGDDSFAGTILGFAAYDSALSAAELKAHADAFFVPEPATWSLLLGAGFVGMARRRRPSRPA